MFSLGRARVVAQRQEKEGPRVVPPRPEKSLPERQCSEGKPKNDAIDKLMKAQTAGSSILPRLPSAEKSARFNRWYQLTVKNLSGIAFGLSAPPRAARLGRVLQVAPSLSAGTTWVAVSAVFGKSATCGDVLEFALSFSDAESRGFTVRVHGHDRSPLESDAITSNPGLDVVSELEHIPRYVARPPQGYETSLGVYASPARDEGSRIGALKAGDEVFLGGLKEGRWAQLTAPMEGWVMWETRSGVSCFAEEPGSHLRQRVTLKLASSSEPASQGGEAGRALGWTGPSAEDRDSERTAWTARYQAQKEIDRKNSEMEGQRLLGQRTREVLTGVL